MPEKVIFRTLEPLFVWCISFASGYTKEQIMHFAIMHKYLSYP